MKTSFTDEQLLNLINNKILRDTSFSLDSFTGGGVQITSTYNHQIIKHKVYLTFGYDEKRNSKSYAFEINEDVSFLWQQALLLKVKSLQTLNSGNSFSDLNELMNTKIEIVDRDKECKEVVKTSLRNSKKPFSFSLDKQRLLSNTSKEYKEKLKEYINNSGKAMSYEDFYNQCEMKPYKYKNFKMAYDSWNKDNNKSIKRKEVLI